MSRWTNILFLVARSAFRSLKDAEWIVLYEGLYEEDCRRCDTHLWEAYRRFSLAAYAGSGPRIHVEYKKPPAEESC